MSVSPVGGGRGNRVRFIEQSGSAGGRWKCHLLKINHLWSSVGKGGSAARLSQSICGFSLPGGEMGPGVGPPVSRTPSGQSVFLCCPRWSHHRHSPPHPLLCAGPISLVYCYFLTFSSPLLFGFAISFDLFTSSFQTHTHWGDEWHPFLSISALPLPPLLGGTAFISQRNLISFTGQQDEPQRAGTESI